MPFLVLALLLPAAHAELPMPTWPECGEADRPDLCPPDLGEAWNLISYIPAAWQRNVRPEELTMGSGLWADQAWRITTGRTDIVVAVLDSGIHWDDTRLIRKHFLNRSELPLPQVGDQTGSGHDTDEDGVLTVDDYALDPRVSMTAGVDAADGILDPSDLIHTFSDGVDDDGNGFVDDIAGWDFFWNDNDPYDDTRYGHGSGEAEDSCEGGNDGDGIGTCPNCMVLNVRVGDSYVADGASFAMGVLYATDMGASVIQEALGAPTNPSIVRKAIDYAWAGGVTVVGSAADETAFHANFPGANPHTVYVHAIRYDTESREEATTFLAYSNCTNHGARLDLSAPSVSCSSGATGVTSGVAGLLHSAARDASLRLTGAEAWQLLVQHADDIDVPDSTGYPSKPGWDRYFGQGRVNAFQSVQAVQQLHIPPEVDFSSPDWFTILDPTLDPLVEVEGWVAANRSALDRWVLEQGEGLDPETFREVATGSTTVDGVLAPWDASDLALDPSAPIDSYPLGWSQVEREEAVNRYTVTLRLRAWDVEGRMGEARRVLYVHHDPDAMEGWPLAFATSFESSPKLFDLDADGAREILIGDTDGRLHALRFDGFEVAGWPVHTELLEEVDPNDVANHLDSLAFRAIDPDIHASIVSTPAVGDIDGDGSADVVYGSLRGTVFAVRADGSPLDGFPVWPDLPEPTDEYHIYDDGIFSAITLGDLDGDGLPEIVTGAMDGRVYAWNHDGSRVPGFPVALRHPDYPDAGARIVSSPALGDLDGDGSLDIVIGTNETLDGSHAAVYAMGADGIVKPGWPVTLWSLMSDVLPYVGQGSPTTPAIGDLDHDGDLEVVTWGLAGSVTVLHHDGSMAFVTTNGISDYGSASNANETNSLPLCSSPSLGDLDGDGTPDIVAGTAGIGYASGQEDDGHFYAFDHLLGAWDGNDGSFLEGWPQVMEDLQFFMVPAIADVDGDRRVEAINGSGGFMLHAWNEDGVEPDGWPKFTGQWVLPSPAVGDVDGDGLIEVVAATRWGTVFVWNTPSPAGADVEWASFGHDPQNTSNFETPLLGYNSGYPVVAPRDAADAEDPKGGCGCAASTGTGFGWMAGILGLVRMRRRKPAT